MDTMRAVVTAGTTTTTYRLNTTSSDIGDRRVERAITTMTRRIATWEVTSTQRALTGQSADHWGQDVILGWEEKGIVECGHIRDVQATLPDELQESVQARLQTGMSAEVKYMFFETATNSKSSPGIRSSATMGFTQSADM